MGTTLTGTTPANTYDSLIKVTDNGPLSGTAKYLSDGLGNDSVLALSTAQVGIGVIPAAGVGNLQVGGTANASIFSQQGTDTVRAGVRASGRVGIVFDSSDATYTNRMWYLDSVGANGTLTIGRQGLDVMTFANAGNVGIGTSNPSVTLSVVGPSGSPNVLSLSGANSNCDIIMQSASTSSPTRLRNATNDFQIHTLGSERMRITSTGNVGIGTSNPTAKLDVNGEVYISPNTVGKNTFTFTTNAFNDGRFLIKSDTTTNVDIQSNGVSYFNGGNVGIGTASPDDKLTVKGIIKLLNDEVAAGYATLDIVPATAIGASANRIAAINTTDIAFETGAAERFRITNNGVTFNGDTAAANALDDYEEGTFTPSIAFGGGSTGITYFDRVGNYTKIGRKVYVQMYVALINKGTDTGNATITNLPFTVASTNRGSVGTVSLDFADITFTGQMSGQAGQSATQITFVNTTEAGARTIMTNANFTNASQFWLNITYNV